MGPAGEDMAGGAEVDLAIRALEKAIRALETQNLPYLIHCQDAYPHLRQRRVGHLCRRCRSIRLPRAVYSKEVQPPSCMRVEKSLTMLRPP